MTSKTLSRITLATAVIIGSLSVSGCTINIGSPASLAPSSSSTTFSSGDLMFAQMMIPHHEQAIAMSALAQTRTDNPEILALALQIAAEQEPEIEQMARWLGSDSSGNMMHHNMAMDGMLSDDAMAALEKAQGAEFDRLYLEGMIQHHEGAVQMAKMVIGSGNDEAKELGQKIVSGQTEQIAEMKALLASK